MGALGEGNGIAIVLADILDRSKQLLGMLQEEQLFPAGLFDFPPIRPKRDPLETSMGMDGQRLESPGSCRATVQRFPYSHHDWTRK